ncbi:hypothetical protein AB1Y20_017145 [Prymnesium parvum]|uniref:SKI-interacting protein SKIP SNW domain-containing protein n=1 Tax=Prymnesium parvum TaxID=97485 RepID=A0AB34IAN8_PRYPA
MALQLPPPLHTPAPLSSSPPAASHPSAAVPPRGAAIPPQGSRRGWVPRAAADFGDGGAFPEIHVAQYPLEMGRKGKASGQVLALTTDEHGKARHDLIARVGQREGKVVHSSKDALTQKQMDEEALQKPGDDAAIENTERTRRALEAMVASKASAAHGSLDRAVADKKEPTYIRYTPSSQGGAQASGATNRVIRMVEAPVDPMEPPKFKHKRVPRGPPSPPAPVMHSPPRKITLKDQQDWKIPPCISNWKNIKGYTIPLDKRLAADGRGLQEVEKRATIQKKIAAKDKERKEEELRALAQRAREERSALPAAEASDGSPSPQGEAAERDELRRERKRERERERRLENKEGKRSRMTRDAERDVSERIALGQAVPNSSETLYDQRLFNQAGGLSSGLAADDTYNIYDKALFRGAASDAIYRPTRASHDEWGDEDAAVAEVSRRARFGLGEASSSGAPPPPPPPRGRPVEFEEEQDPFGLDEMLTEARGGKGMAKVGEGAGMGAAAGGGGADARGSGRSSLDFAKERG